MEYIATRGYDVYLVDLRGYGRSTRPKEMEQDPKANPPIVRGETAVKDISAAVNFILARRSIGDIGGRRPRHHHGKESPQAFRSSAVVPRRSGQIIAGKSRSTLQTCLGERDRTDFNAALNEPFESACAC